MSKFVDTYNDAEVKPTVPLSTSGVQYTPDAVTIHNESDVKVIKSEFRNKFIPLRIK